MKLKLKEELEKYEYYPKEIECDGVFPIYYDYTKLEKEGLKKICNKLGIEIEEDKYLSITLHINDLFNAFVYYKRHT